MLPLPGEITAVIGLEETDIMNDKNINPSRKIDLAHNPWVVGGVLAAGVCLGGYTIHKKASPEVLKAFTALVVVVLSD